MLTARHCPSCSAPLSADATPRTIYCSNRCVKAAYRQRQRRVTPTVPAAPAIVIASRRGFTTRELAQLFEVSRRTIQRWRHEAFDRAAIDIYRADAVATALGEHPTALWPDYAEVQ